jgi:hypothetical protein
LDGEGRRGMNVRFLSRRAEPRLSTESLDSHPARGPGLNYLIRSKKESGMQAYIVEEPNGDFREVDLPHPKLNRNHALIRVQASGVSALDTKIRGAKPHTLSSHFQQCLDLTWLGSLKR